MNVAVLDLGTNTFNLLIANLERNNFEILANTKESVKIGRAGIHKNIILPDAMDRAIKALENHFKMMSKYQLENIYAIGTSALRTAENAAEFTRLVKEKFSIDIAIISGEREAELIYKGVNLSLKGMNEAFVILDIGGGSNEFIIATNEKILWKQSFPIGMARLNEQFKPSDPIKLNEIVALESHFDHVLQPLFETISRFPAKCLIGAEGAFETFLNCIDFERKKNRNVLLLEVQDLKIEEFFAFHNRLITTTTKERLAIKGMEAFRVEMIVPATIFVNFVIKKLQIEEIKVSEFSLKEGIIAELLDKK